MFGAFILSSWPENEAPDHPIVGIFRLFLNSLSDFLDCFYNIAFLKLSKGPMHMGVVTISVKLFSLTADVERLFINHMHVEEESQIVIGKWMHVV